MPTKLELEEKIKDLEKENRILNRKLAEAEEALEEEEEREKEEEEEEEGEEEGGGGEGVKGQPIPNPV